MSIKISYNRRSHPPALRRSSSRDVRDFWRKFIQPRGLISAVVVIVSLLILLNAIFGQHGYLVMRRQQQALKQAAEQLDRAHAEQQRLKKQLDNLRTPEGIERAAREQIKLVKPGEIVVTLPDSGNTAPPPAKTDSNSSSASPSTKR